MKKRLSKFLVGVMLFNVLFSGLVRAEGAGGETQLYFDGVQQVLSVPIEKMDGMSYVYGHDLAPLFDYNEGDGEIHIIRKSVDMKITFGSSAVQVNGIDRLFESPIYWTGGKNYVNLEMLTRVFGIDMTNDEIANRIDVTLKTYVEVSGSVFLPTGDMAEEDLPFYVSSNSTRTKVIIPKGSTTIQYSIYVPEGKGFTIGYQLQDTPKYLSGYYSKGGTVSNPNNADELNSTSPELQNIDLHLIRAPYISGLIRLPDGVSVPDEGLTVHLGGHYYNDIYNCYQYAETIQTLLKGQTQVPYKAYIADDTASFIESWCYTIKPDTADLYNTGYYRKDGTTSYKYGDSIGMKTGKAENIDITLIQNQKFTGTVKLPGNKRAVNDIRGSIYIARYSNLYGEVMEVPETEVPETEVPETEVPKTEISEFEMTENPEFETAENSETSMAVSAPTPTPKPPSGGGGGGISYPSALPVLIPAGQNSATYTVTLPEDSTMNSYTLRYSLQNSDEYYYWGYYNESGTSSQYGSGIPINQTPPVLTLIDMYTISGTASKPAGFHADFQMAVRVSNSYFLSSAWLNFTSADTKLPYSVKLPADGEKYMVSYSIYNGSGSALLKPYGIYAKGGVIKDVYTDDSWFDLKGNVSGIDFTPLLAQENPEHAVTINKVIDGYGRIYNLINNIDSPKDDYYYKSKFSVDLLNWSGKTVSGKVEAKLYNKDGGLIETVANNFNMLSLSNYTANMAFSSDPPANTAYIEITVTDSNGKQLTEPFVSRRYTHTDDPNAIALDGYNAEMINGVVMYRLRSIAEILGSSVSYDESTQSMTVRRNSKDIVFKIGAYYAEVNGYSCWLYQAPVMWNGQFMVEGDSINDVLDMYSWWDNETSIRTFYVYWGSDILDINNIDDLSIDYKFISGNVSADAQSFLPDMVVSDGATWKVFRDVYCTQEIADGIMQLEFGRNVAYIKVTSNDNYEHIYELFVTRKSMPITALTINTPANLSQTSTTRSEVCFTVLPTPDKDIDTSKIQWYVNKELQAQTGLNFTYTPTGAGNYSVVAKVEDSLVTSESRTITVTAAPNDATLSHLNFLPYESENSFDLIGTYGESTDYYIVLSKEDANPQINYYTTNPAAHVAVTNAASIPGNTTLVVTSEDGTETKTYTIHWTYDSDFYYEDDGKSITLTGYHGGGGNVILPCVINGKWVTDIGEWAFERNSSITAAVIPDCVSRIGYGAFYGCKNLTSVNIPNGLQSIESYTFAECSSLLSIYVPEKVEVIDEVAFSSCDRLMEINVARNNRYFSSADGVLFNKDKTELIQFPGGKNGAYKVPDSVIRFANYAFFMCKGLTSVEIPNSLTDIGHSTFSECKSLVSVNIPASISIIEAYVFSGCESLRSIHIPDNIRRIYYNAFYGCNSLTSVNIPKNVDYIDGAAFDNCDNLVEINADENNKFYSSADGVLFNDSKTALIKYPTGRSGEYIIPNTVTEIGYNAFGYCNKLTSVIIPNGVLYIQSWAYYNCSKLLSVSIPNGVRTIDYGTFANCESLTEITIPESVTSIGDNAFSNCSSLTSFVIPNGVTSINQYTFASCSSLTSIVIPESIKSIGYSAFIGCSSLSEVMIPEGVISIDNWTFAECSSLSSIIIPDSVTKIEDSAFWSCNATELNIFCNPGTVAATFAVDNGFQTRPMPVWPAFESRTYTPGFKLSDLPLTEGFVWEAPETTLNAPGGNYKVTYTTADGLHTFSKLVEVMVEKVPAPNLPVLDPITYSPSATLSDITLPDGWTWKQPDTVLIVPGGEYGINYTPTDAVNYSDLKTTIHLTVNKADPVVIWPVLKEVTYKVNLKLSDIVLPAGFSWAQPGTILKVPGGSYDVVYTPQDTANYNTMTKAIPLVVNSPSDTRSDSPRAHSSGTVTVTPPQPSQEPHQPNQVKPVPNDITEVAWAQEYISDVLNRGIMQGYTQADGTTSFMPSATATRAEFATALFNYLGFEQDGTTDFADTRDHWAKGYISKMVKEGIMTGYNAETFDPDAPVTREQMAVILYRAFGTKTAVQDTRYNDGNTISAWAVDSVYAIRDAGWMSGDSDGSFRPGDTAIRAEIATIFSRLAKADVKRK